MATWMAVDKAAGDLEGQVHRAVRERILDGRLTTGQRLPSSRALAIALGVARSTVVHAYERLAAEGFVEGRAGSATRVAPLPPPPKSPWPAGPIPSVARPPVDARPPDGMLRPGVPDLAAFPHALWARCLAARARTLRGGLLGYGEASGLPALKAAVLDHVASRRGVSAAASQVMILPSTGAALDLLARLLLQPGKPGGDIVWIEEPGYPAAHALLRGAGARLVPVPCDDSGLDLARAEGPPPRLLYVTPSHQYPTGATMSLPRRLALLDFAQATGTIVIEDDYDSEFHYAARPIAALQGIDRGRSVVYLGTFSKVLAPGLRVAYAVLPPQLVPAAMDALTLRGAVVPIHVQAALADFLEDGHLRAHIRRMGPRYAERMALTVDVLTRACGDVLSIVGGQGGLQVAAWFRDGAADDQAVARVLAAAGYAVPALSGLHLGPSRAGLLFGIARAQPAEVETAARLVAEALRPGPSGKA